jgi:site-specific DNA-cytosine methylase
MILANTPPDVALLEDVTRTDDEVPSIDLYISGFSCKPFSMLHGGTKLLQEPEAKIFFAVLNRIQQLQPPAFVLENVQGISRCMSEVLSLLQKAGYIVAVESLNPVELGEPVNRPRYYFVGVRADVALLGQDEAQDMYRRVWSNLKQKRSSHARRTSCTSGTSGLAPLFNRILPGDHDLVLAHKATCLEKWQHAQKQGFPDKSTRTKWQQAHADWAAGREFKLAEGNPQLAQLTPDRLLLHLPRERDGWWKLIRTTTDPAKVVADISQSLGRMPYRTDGALPTITPGGHIVLAGAARCLIPAEKLLLHCLPLHRMVIPEGVSDSDLECMGGNMMHLQTVGFAMLLALSLVDWHNPAARAAPAKPAAIAVSAEAAMGVAQRKPKAATKWEKKLEMQLKARFGMLPMSKKVGKRSKLKNFNALLARMPEHKACLCGTRWAC